MKRSTGNSKKRILIVVVWIIFLVVFGFVAFRVEYHRCSENEQKDLVRQAGNIGLLTPAIFYNDQYVQDCIDKTMPIRMRVLAGGLEKYEDIEDAMMLLEGFQSEAGLESLAVYDAKGNVLYGDGELGAELNLDPEEIKRILTTGGKDSEDSQIGIETVGDRWLLIGKNKESFNQKLMENYYSWRHSLEILTGEMTTDIISISTENGTILFDSDDLMTGLSMKEADIQTQDGTALTNTQELKSLFTDSDQSVLIQIDGEPYFASLISSPQEDMLLVAIMSEQAVTDEASYVMILIFLFVFLVTGLCTAYAYFHISRQRKECSDEEGRGRRTPALATGLTISGAVAVIAVIGFSIYIAVLSMYSNAYKNGREMLDHAQTLYSTNLEGSEVVKNWSDEEYLTRTRMARCVLMDQDQKETTKEYLISLAGTLEVQDISVYDKTGSFQASALYYFQPNIEQNSPFYVLLQGENYVVGDPEADGTAGMVLRKMGASMRDEEGDPDGCILIAEDLEEQKELGNITHYEYLFRELSAPYGSKIAVVEEEQDGILYLGTVWEGGYEEYSAEEEEYLFGSVEKIGIEREQLQDSNDGSTRIGDERYVFSVRQNDENWLILMQKWEGVSPSVLRPALWIALMVLVYCVILLALSCLGKKNRQTDLEEEQAGQTENAGPGKRDPETIKKEFMARLENLLYKDKPYFEERWPDETKKWNMKTPWEQFRAVTKYMLLLFVVGIFILFLIEGDSSMLSVCLQSDWKGGFNLHSITAILLMIGWLFTAKVVIHKVLYLLARVSGPRGETICNMIDSYSDYILVLIGFFVSLNQLLGVSAAELSLTSGIIGIILGIGCESIVADMLAGILMAFDGAVHVGDVVFFEGERNYVISIGVRTTKLKLNGKTTVVRNNDFKNYVTVPAKGKISESAYFRVNLSESIERIEGIIDREMPVIHDRMVPRWKDMEGPFYWGVNDVSDSWIEFCIYIEIDGAHYTQAIAQLKAELKMMCDRNHIQLAMRQIVVHEENTEK